MYELVWFVGGAVVYKFLSKFLAMAQSTVVFKAVEQNILIILATLTEDISYIKSLRYQAMRDASVNPEQIKKNRRTDEEFFEGWKTTCVQNIHASTPIYVKPSFASWEEGMDLISDLYRAQKHEKRKK